MDNLCVKAVSVACRVAIPIAIVHLSVGLSLIVELPWLMGCYCTSRMVEHSKTQLAKPECMSGIAKLLMSDAPFVNVMHSMFL